MKPLTYFPWEDFVTVSDHQEYFLFTRFTFEVFPCHNSLMLEESVLQAVTINCAISHLYLYVYI